MPKVSVLMPIYKTKKNQLRQAIASVLFQTYMDFEFLIINDSPEETYLDKIVESFSDTRIHYFKNEKNLGITLSHNRLLDLAQGVYLAVMDHDDVMDKNRLAKQVAYMEANPSVGVCGTAYRRFGDWKKSKTIYPTEHSEDIKAELFFRCPLLHPSLMIRAQVIKEHHISYNADYISANDRHLYLDIMPYADFHNLQEVLMCYRIHANMTSKTKRDAIVAEQKRLRSEMLANVGAKLSADEERILNDFVLKGRCRIKEVGILAQVVNILEKIDKANQKSHYFPPDSFSKLCAKYLIKRCLNAAVYGRISSKGLLKQTTLPVQQIKIPTLLKLLNYLLPSKLKRSEAR